MTAEYIIGWDIGIKNLAYCILETSTTPQEHSIKFNNTYYNIKQWKDISLVSQIDQNLQHSGEVSHINTILKCCHPKTNKLNAPHCVNNAVYCAETRNVDGTYKGYCKIHFKKSGISRMPMLNVSKCYHLDCSSKAIQVLANHIYIGYCKKHINEFITTGQKQAGDFLKINRAKTTSKIDINHLGIALFQELDKNKNMILEPNIILLENQPVLKNPTMKSMQMFLYSYYLMKHIDSGLGNKHLQCYTASKKLDLIKFFPESQQKHINTILANVKSGYQKNKKMSVLMMEYLLRDNIKWLDYFNQHPKKDDLADSFLMTLHYFEKTNLAKLIKINKDETKSRNTNLDTSSLDTSNGKRKSKGKKNMILDDDLDQLIDQALTQ